MNRLLATSTHHHPPRLGATGQRGAGLAEPGWTWPARGPRWPCCAEGRF